MIKGISERFSLFEFFENTLLTALLLNIFFRAIEFFHGNEGLF